MLTGERDETTDQSSGKNHTEAQWITTTILLFDYCGTELSTCSWTSLAMTHTTDCSATYGGTLSEPHTSLVMFFQQSQQQNNFLHRTWSNKLPQTNVILHSWLCVPDRPQNSTEHDGAGLHSTTKTVHEHWTLTYIYHCNYADRCTKRTRSDLDLWVQTLWWTLYFI